MPSGDAAAKWAAWRWALYVIYCVEMGLIFMLAPWSNYWEFNYFAQEWTWLRPLWAHGALRGAVTGLGLVLAYLGLEALLRRPPEEGPASHA